MIKDLTKTEKKVARAFYSFAGCKYSPKDVDPELIRSEMRETAWHEAGHFAAHVFTRNELANIQIISIIPPTNALINGYVRCEARLSQKMLHKMSPELKRIYGYILLLEYLAGYGASVIEFPGYYDLMDYVFDGDDIGDDGKLDDIGVAKLIAKCMAKPHLSERRILIQAVKWTVEMLHIPSVWDTVHATAKILLSKGEVSLRDRGIANLAFNPDVATIYKMAKWRKRLRI